MSTPTHPNPAAAPSRSWPLRIAGFLTGAALLLLGFIVALGYVINSLQLGGSPNLVAGVIFAVLLALGVLAWKRIPLLGTWPRVAGGALVAVAGLAWLAKDDPDYTHPRTLAELSGDAGAEAAASYELTLRYTTRPGHTPAQFTEGKFHVQESPAEKPAEWLAAIEKMRPEITAEWERLAPEREWFAAMDAYAAIGDDATAGFEAPVMRFAPYRRVTTVGSARAGLLALEGKGDEAMDIVLRQLSLSAKLERNSRTLLRSMMALTSWRDGLATAKFVLARAKVSAEKRAALAAVIAGREEHEKVLRRLVWVDFVNLRTAALERNEVLPGLLESEMGGIGPVMGSLRPLVFLPRHTANLTGTFLTKLEAAAIRRASKDDYDVLGQEYYQIFHVDGPKNIGGKLLMTIAVPNLSRPIERSWAVEDLRKELLAQLAA